MKLLQIYLKQCKGRENMYGFLQHYEEEGRKSLSVCFCLLDQMSSEDEDSLRAMQREMTESCMKIRQSYVFGDQTVNASEFTEFRPGFYTKVEKGIQSYSDSEALFLAEEMIKKKYGNISSRQTIQT